MRTSQLACGQQHRFSFRWIKGEIRLVRPGDQLAERAIKVSNIVREIFHSALFIKHGIISVLTIRNGATEGILH